MGAPLLLPLTVQDDGRLEVGDVQRLGQRLAVARVAAHVAQAQAVQQIGAHLARCTHTQAGHVS